VLDVDKALEDIIDLFAVRTGRWCALVAPIFQLTSRLSIPYMREAELLHFHNFQIWHYENYCRTSDEEKIVFGKRGSVKHNKLRNDCIERLDQYFVKFQYSGGYNSETLGSIVDKISVFFLKEKYCESEDSHRIAKLQLVFLQDAARHLWRDMLQGRSRIRLFKSLKTYHTDGLGELE